MSAASVHYQSLHTSSALAEYYVENFISPLEVIRVLNAAKIRFMLIGAHGLGGWMQEPRATQDVDVLVMSKHHKKAVRLLTAAFVHLDCDDHEVVTRLRDKSSKKVLIDVVKPTQPIFREALKNAKRIKTKDEEYDIPSLEMALALKFAPMVSPNRADEKKYLDAHDFIRMVRVNPDIDLAKLTTLGELVYPGGGAEITEKVRQVRAGEKLQL